MVDHPHQKIIVSNFHAYLHAKKKINFITHFSLKMFQINSKVAILNNLGMPGHTK